MANETIGKAAEKAGVKIATIRYYERRGLIAQPRKPESGFRIYPQETIRRVCFIRQAQDIGFSLAEIEELLSLEAAADADCGDVRERAMKKRAEVEAKIRRLNSIREALDELIAACPGRGAIRSCSILKALDARRRPARDVEKEVVKEDV